MQSLSKNKIKWIRSLQLKKNRDELGLFIVEGEKMVQEAIENFSQQIDFLVVTKFSSIKTDDVSFEVAIATDEELKSISNSKLVVEEEINTDTENHLAEDIGSVKPFVPGFINLKNNYLV